MDREPLHVALGARVERLETSEAELESLLGTREEPAVEQPASIRSSIGIARLSAERAKRLKVAVDNSIVAQTHC